MAVLLRLLAALAVMLVAAALVFAISRGHIFFFPFILVLGAPLWWALRAPRDRVPPSS